MNRSSNISMGDWTTNEAIKRVAKERGLSRNDVYKEYHELS